MDKSINILDQDYSLWIQDLSKRYRRSQIKASIKVNGEMLKFYWSLGRDIVAMKAESRWGSKFFKNLSKDLKEANQKATCFSEGNLKYMKNFYCMYQPYFEIGQQVADQFQNGKNTQQLVEQNSKKQFGQQVADQIWKDITSTPVQSQLHVRLLYSFGKKACFHLKTSFLTICLNLKKCLFGQRKV